MQHILRLGLGSLLALTVAGCATNNKEKERSVETAPLGRLVKREAALNSTWRGQQYDTLREAYGEPILMMNVIGYRPLRTSLVVYGVVDEDANCIDAFTMVKEEETGVWSVADYFCR